MSEFKGTKGKWEVTDGTSLIGVRLGNEGKLFAIQNNNTEGRANALLISKAPEMLEMLKECKRVLDSVQSPATPAMVLSQEIDILIKQATEI